LLYIERIFIGYFAGIAGYSRKNEQKGANGKQKHG